MRMNYAALLLISLMAALNHGCDGGMYDDERAKYYIESYNMDGTKLIVNGNNSGNDGNTFDQERYTLNHSSRLLTRFENLKNYSASIKQSYDNHVYLRLT